MKNGYDLCDIRMIRKSLLRYIYELGCNEDAFIDFNKIETK